MRENVSLAGDRIGWWLSGGTDYVAPTELKTILGVGFYKYAAPNGAKSCCRGDGDSGSNRIDDVRPRVAPPEAPAERYICSLRPQYISKLPQENPHSLGTFEVAPTGSQWVSMGGNLGRGGRHLGISDGNGRMVFSSSNPLLVRRQAVV